MIRINLLPHREMRRRERQRAFLTASAAMVAVGVVIVVLVHGLLAARIEVQKGRNNFLESEIATLDKQIVEIRRLREQTQQMLARKRVVETLQANRSEIVELFDQVARQLPEGVYLRTVKQNDNTINITGFAQSNARVSTLMRNLEASPLLESAKLVEIKAATVNTQRLNEFSMNVSITRKVTEAKGPAPAAGTAAKK
ncbi:MAG: PilN domain-containing protein [Pseudomonadota bacterium]|jgi:type IV pilus assembly protein PilN